MARSARAARAAAFLQGAAGFRHHHLGGFHHRGLRALLVEGDLALLEQVNPVSYFQHLAVVVRDDDDSHLAPVLEVAHQIQDHRRFLDAHGRQRLPPQDELRADVLARKCRAVGRAGRGWLSSHQALPAARSRASRTLAIIAIRIAPPKMMSSGLALTPATLSPLMSVDSTIAPRNAPRIVPCPPSIAVPPMTAAVTA